MFAGRKIDFFKLEALRNDFVLIDVRESPAWRANDSLLLQLADRRSGVGCDQVLILEVGEPGFFARVRIFNADASPAEQCGNGMRAIAAWARGQGELGTGLQLATDAGPVYISSDGDAYVADLPPPRAMAREQMPEPWPTLPPFCSRAELWSLGNPHLVVETEEPVTPQALQCIADAFDALPAWKNRINIGLARRRSGDAIDLRVHERGSGATPACGSGACAAAASVLQREPTRTLLRVDQPGGSVVIDWRPGNAAIRTRGTARLVFRGTMEGLPEGTAA